MGLRCPETRMGVEQRDPRKMNSTKVTLRAACAVAILATLAGCGGSSGARRGGSQASLECMQRAMFFESLRSSRDGMVAVGSVVMNRVDSDDFPDSVCGVVGQKGQFAPGVMSRRMDSRSLPLVQEAAGSVLAGERHPLVSKARFFHAATYHAPYDNMHYVVTAGGNAFYEKRPSALVRQPSPLPPLEGVTGR